MTKKTLTSLALLVPLLAGCSTVDKEYWRQTPKEFYQNLLGKDYSSHNHTLKASMARRLQENTFLIQSWPLAYQEEVRK